MKNINTLIVLALLSATTGTIQAEVVAMPPTDGSSSTSATDSAFLSAASAAPGDPTEVFFRSLANCIAGYYQEYNLISATIGPDMLRHQINGMNKEVCEVTLGTPDGRNMNCSFQINDLNALSEPHFMSGILTNTVNEPRPEADRSDQLWNNLKATSCSF